MVLVKIIQNERLIKLEGTKKCFSLAVFHKIASYPVNFTLVEYV